MKSFYDTLCESYLPKKMDYGINIPRFDDGDFIESGDFDITYMKHNTWIFQVAISTDGYVDLKVASEDELSHLDVEEYEEYLDFRKSDLNSKAARSLRIVIAGVMQLLLDVKQKFHLTEVTFEPGNKQIGRLYQRMWNDPKFNDLIKSNDYTLYVDESEIVPKFTIQF